MTPRMTCNHCWEDVCTDFYPHCHVFVEYCLACHASRKVIVWDDGEVDTVYNCPEGEE